MTGISCEPLFIGKSSAEGRCSKNKKIAMVCRSVVVRKYCVNNRTESMLSSCHDRFVMCFRKIPRLVPNTLCIAYLHSQLICNYCCFPYCLFIIMRGEKKEDDGN